MKFFSDYLNNSHKEDIDKIENLINKLKINSLNFFFEQKTKNEIKSYEKSYFEIAKKAINRQKSVFFNETYKYYKTYTNKKDNDLLKDVKNHFKKFKNLFEKKFNKIDNYLLIKCLRPFLKKGENEIKKELETIIDILEIKDVKNINEISKELLPILKREYISNTASAINLFITVTKPKRTDFS